MSLLPRENLNFGQRLMATGTSADVILQALENGWVDVASLNTPDESGCLVGQWIRESNPGPSLASHLAAEGLELDPGCLSVKPLDVLAAHPGIQRARLCAQAALGEAMLMRLVEAGLDPLAPLRPSRRQSRTTCLLDWAAHTNRPWLLHTCLSALDPQVRTSWVRGPLADATALPDLEDDALPGCEDLPRIHAALSLCQPLVAQVCFQAGADPAQPAADGATAIFFAADPATLSWALAHGGRLDETDGIGTGPVEHWRRRASATAWGTMREMVEAMGKHEGLADSMLQEAIGRLDVDAVKAALPGKARRSSRLPCGHTALGWAAIVAMGADQPGKVRRDATHARKILAHLWPRTDLAAASSIRMPSSRLTDLGLAFVASSCLGGLASQAMGRLKLEEQACPAFGDIHAWVSDRWGERPSLASTNRIHSWMATEAARDIAKGDLGRGLERAHGLLGAMEQGEGLIVPSVLGCLTRASIDLYVGSRDSGFSGSRTEMNSAANMATRTLVLAAQARAREGDGQVVPGLLEAAAGDLTVTTFGGPTRPFASLCATVFGWIQGGVCPAPEWLGSAVVAVEGVSDEVLASSLEPVLREASLEAGLPAPSARKARPSRM